MSSRFLRFFVLAALLLLIPSFVYLSHRRADAVRDPHTGEWILSGIMQSVQGYNPSLMSTATTTPFFDMGEWGKLITTKEALSSLQMAENAVIATTTTTTQASLPTSEVAVDGAYAPKMTNATAKYVQPTH
ncbi:hypothetical protein ACI68E_001749 [Malassezia pachydermatis]